MKEFWVNSGQYFIEVEFFIIGLTVFSLNFYTGTVKKLDLIIRDIRTIGEPKFDVIYFDKFFRNKGLDPMGKSIFTHMFFKIPNKKGSVVLYDNAYFINQLMKVMAYRRVYKCALIFCFINLLFIAAMAHFFGSNIR